MPWLEYDQLLNLTKDSTAAEVGKKYRTLMLLIHPDKAQYFKKDKTKLTPYQLQVFNPNNIDLDEASEETLLELLKNFNTNITTARDILCDPSAKAAWEASRPAEPIRTSAPWQNQTMPPFSAPFPTSPLYNPSFSSMPGATSNPTGTQPAAGATQRQNRPPRRKSKFAFKRKFAKEEYQAFNQLFLSITRETPVLVFYSIIEYIARRNGSPRFGTYDKTGMQEVLKEFFKAEGYFDTFIKKNDLDTLAQKEGLAGELLTGDDPQNGYLSCMITLIRLRNGISAESHGHKKSTYEAFVYFWDYYRNEAQKVAEDSHKKSSSYSFNYSDSGQSSERFSWTSSTAEQFPRPCFASFFKEPSPRPAPAAFAEPQPRPAFTQQPRDAEPVFTDFQSPLFKKYREDEIPMPVPLPAEDQMAANNAFSDFFTSAENLSKDISRKRKAVGQSIDNTESSVKFARTNYPRYCE